MISQIVKTPALLAVGLIVLFGPVLAVAQTTASSGHYYYYFDQKIPLTCDTKEIAVFEAGTEDTTTAALSNSMSQYGIAADGIRQSPVPRLSFCQTPGTVGDDKGVRELVADISRDPGVDFASPVFSAEFSDKVIISQYLHVGFAENIDAKKAEAILADMNAGVIEERDWAGMKGVYRLKCKSRDGFEVLALANALAKLPEVRFAEPDMVMTVRKSLIPDDPYFPSSWGLHNTGQSGGTVNMDMDGPEAWDISTGDPSIIVVIIDDGVQQDHPDIHQIAGRDFTSAGTDGGPGNTCDDHGTTVAGCTSAVINNRLGVVGIAPGCNVASAKYSISNVPCDGSGWFYSSWLVNAIGWAQTIGARVTNNSSGMGPIGSVTTKYQQTYDAGIVHFASSGNDATSVIGYPANLPTVNAVGAINRYGNRAWFSTYGTGLAFVAPGQSIWTTDRTGSEGYSGADYAMVDGTSYSSPFAAGVAAMVLTVDDTLTSPEVEQIMNDTCMDRGSAGWDVYYGWGILSAFDAMQAASPPGPTTFEGDCYYDAEMTDPVNTVAVDVFNLDTGASWAAATTDNYYSVTLLPDDDITVDDTLRFIAKDGATAVTVADHTVTLADIMADNVQIDLVLDEYYLDLNDFPMYEADAPDVNEMCGPAVAQMTLNYMWWDSTVDPTPPLTFDDQQVLYDYGIANNETPGLDYLDAVGMWHAIQDNRPLPYPQFGYNFSIRHDVDSAEMVKQISQWISYPIGTYGGLEVGHPEHVPGVIPAYGDYTNWMAVRGIHTSEDAYPLPEELEVYGFWMNDPFPSSLGGIGENSYKTVDELLATYYLPMATGDSYDGEYVAICEPPDIDPTKNITIIVSKARFDAEAKRLIESVQTGADLSAETVAAANDCVVRAAIGGVTDELIPYDEGFADLFARTAADEPLFVRNAVGADYYAVPFMCDGGGVVVLVDAEDGRFKETSWSTTAVRYLPVSEEYARKLIMSVMEKYGFKPGELRYARTELLRGDSGPYYPDWRFTTKSFVFSVSQDGTVSLLNG